MTDFSGLASMLETALNRGYTIHSFHQEGQKGFLNWHCRLKIFNDSMAHPRYASGDAPHPADAVRAAIDNAETVLAWKPTLGTLTRLKALKPDLEALLKEI